MAIQFGDLQLDPVRRELSRNGTRIEVEPRVFDLLLHLIENRDRVVSKDDLIAHVWDGRIVSDSALTSAINAARHAVGDDGRTQGLIRTSARRGYRFVASLEQPAIPPFRSVATVESSGNHPAHFPTGRPAIAVLPFQNMSGDPEQEYFADGIVEDIITNLSRLKSLFVIARNSSHSYKGTSPDIRQVGRDLGVRYVLEGSVRRGGERIRVTAQLIDTSSGSHIWAQRYDRAITEVFDLQDELTGSIVRHLLPELTAAEIARSQRKEEKDLTSWELYLRALPLIRSNAKKEVEAADLLLRRAIAAKPDFAAAYAKLSSCRLKASYFGWEEPAAPLMKAFEYARHAIALDPEDGLGFDALASAQQLQGQRQEAIINAQKAIELSEALMAAHGTLVTSLAQCGRITEAFAAFEASERLSPRDPDRSGRLMGLIIARFANGDYAETIRVAKQHMLLQPNWYGSWAYLAAALAHLGRFEEARRAVSRAVQLKPDYTLTMAQNRRGDGCEEGRQRLVEGLRQAGLPE